MKITGAPNEIIDEIKKDHPGVERALQNVRSNVPHLKREVSEYQGATIYALTSQFNGGSILEIGTAWGYSAACMAEGAPQADIVTLNPKGRPHGDEVEKARKHLRGYSGITVLQRTSGDHLVKLSRLTEWTPYDMIFVDGDHNRVAIDLGFWHWLKPGGLFLFHDYSPEGSWRACPPVFSALNRMRDSLGRDFDVLVRDDREVGLAGWYK